MNNCSLLHLLLASVLCLAPHTVAASYLTINGDAKLSVKSTQDGIQIQGTYEIENRGDESAREVFPAFRLGSWAWTGDPRGLDPNAREAWKVDALVPYQKLQCTDPTDSCAGLALPLRGRFPLTVRRHYSSSDGTRFSAPDVLMINAGSIAPEELNLVLVPELIGKLECEGDGQAFECKVIVNNTGKAPKRVAISFHHSQEIQPHTLPTALDLPAQGSNELRAKVKNLTGLAGSIYAFFAIFQWQEGETRNATFAAQPLNIARPRSIVLFVVPAAVVLLLVLGLLLRATKGAAGQK